ncbi:MAG TPA: Crp/Fnr family transcriptional regulator [Vicinamibacterales bacterium]|jgi:CRP-like cAMP-binding protein|nr:Crp/Fnr family transcriptional regulator [Vicinamibacterales bacterium]
MGRARRSTNPASATRPPPSKKAVNPNRLLAALPLDDYARIAPLLAVVPLKLKEILHKPGDPVDHVYFPGGGFCSVLTVLSDGDMIEVATIGREGMVGTSAIMNGAAPEPSVTMVQAETLQCYRMATGAFCQEIERRGVFSVIVARYAQALIGFVMQGTACNAVHSIEQRLARWLLTAQDRVDRNEFPLTQEFVAMMLGATRPTVTVVAGTLQRAGLITYHRGRVTVVDREGLERASCECYRVAAALLKSVISPSSSSEYASQSNAV